jgi:protein-L-isoaspartate(D-aspartate) O-methyltransferase
MPVMAITFYDELRATVGRVFIGPWQGTFDWREVTAREKVPPRAREAIVHIGLFGATGELSFDNIRIRGIKPGEK